MEVETMKSDVKMRWDKKKLTEICKPKQWKIISQSELTETGFVVYGANGKMGYYNDFNHENPVLLIGCRGSCGSIHISEPLSYTNGNAMACDELTSEVDINFLKYFLEHRGFDDIISGGVQKQITIQGLNRIEVPLPPLSTQKRIAEILDAADALRRKDQELLKKYGELAQAIFIDMFGDPVKNEKGWEVRKLYEVCKQIFGGGTPSKSKPEFYLGTIPWVTPKDMKSDIIIDSIDHINEEAVKNSSTKLVPKNSVLMVIRSGILKHTLPVAINDTIVSMNQDLKAFIPNTDLTNAIFLKYFFHGVSDFLLTKVRAVTADNIEFEQIKNMVFICPPIDLQNEFLGRVSIVQKQFATSLDLSIKTESLFDTLIQKAFKGELVK